ncbi:hypothetical protein AUR66_16690 [Haloferax profundi]|uniref:Uncharacterized protein n=1 Tax=Haloferax profundi TaxID=1544718 RepID=A0A0W1SAR3_9EURY|nr:hypothetical protein AUR66_16690 [Haloferax profundi]
MHAFVCELPYVDCEVVIQEKILNGVQSQQRPVYFDGSRVDLCRSELVAVMHTHSVCVTPILSEVEGLNNLYSGNGHHMPAYFPIWLYSEKFLIRTIA